MKKKEKHLDLLDKFKKAKHIEKKKNKLNRLYNLQKQLLKINEEVEESLENNSTYIVINIRNYYDECLDLGYSIFHNKKNIGGGNGTASYSIKLNKKGLIKLRKLLDKVKIKINNLESKGE